MREIGADVAVHEHDFSLIQFRFELWFGLKAVAGVEERGEVRVDTLQGPKLTIQEFGDHFAEPEVILWEARRVNGMAATASREHIVQQVHLRAFAAAVDALESDEPAERPSVYS